MKAPRFGWRIGLDGKPEACPAELALAARTLRMREAGCSVAQIVALLKLERVGHPATGRRLTAPNVRAALARGRALARVSKSERADGGGK